MVTGKIYELDDVILFGQYKDMQIIDIIDSDIGYITYLISEQGIILDNKAFKYYSDKLRNGKLS